MQTIDPVVRRASARARVLAMIPESRPRSDLCRCGLLIADWAGSRAERNGQMLLQDILGRNQDNNLGVADTQCRTSKDRHPPRLLLGHRILSKTCVSCVYNHV